MNNEPEEDGAAAGSDAGGQEKDRAEAVCAGESSNGIIKDPVKDNAGRASGDNADGGLNNAGESGGESGGDNHSSDTAKTCDTQNNAEDEKF